MENYDKMIQKLKEEKAIEKNGKYMNIISMQKVKEEIAKMEDEERQGTINDIENLVEDSYESMYKDLAKEYKYIKEEYERQREEIQEMLQDILQLECEYILNEMNEKLEKAGAIQTIKEENIIILKINSSKKINLS